MFEVMEKAADFYQQQLRQNLARTCHSYLQDRGLRRAAKAFWNWLRTTRLGQFDE